MIPVLSITTIAIILLSTSYAALKRYAQTHTLTQEQRDRMIIENFVQEIDPDARVDWEKVKGEWSKTQKDTK